MFDYFGSVAYLSARYPYEVIVFFIVLSIGIWPVAESSFLVKTFFGVEHTNELDLLIVVAKCLSTLHIFYQGRKLKLLNSTWLFIACALIGLTVCLNMSVVASLIAANLKGTYDVFSILPILLMVTELDFAHALLVMTVKSLSSKDSVPLCIRANMKILSRRALITSALDLACIILVLLGSSQYESHHHALTFTLKIGFVSVLFNFALFLTLLPAIITLIAYYFPRRALMAISSDNEMEHLAARASTTLKVGAGFEVFALISATFVLGQSRLLVGRLARRLLPDPMLIILGDVIAYLPFDFTTSIHSTGVKTLMLVSLFRYLVLENVRSHRSRRITLDKPKLKPKKEETVELEEDSDDAPDETSLIRPIDELLEMMKNGNMERLTINECCALVEQGHIRPHMLEKALGDARRGVYVRRKLLDSPVMRHIRADNYDYSVATKTCCENVIGYLQMPLGQIGPLRVDEVDCRPILATTEGALVASVNRGCKLLTKSGGVKTHILKDAMSRAPCLMFDTVAELHAAVKWIESNGDVLKEHFESTTRFGRLQSVTPFAVGRYLYVRCSASTGDAMGMNMVSKGTEKVVEAIKHHFPQCRCISLSGNACTDKKPSAMNWIEGRGKSIIAECTIPETDLKAILKVSAADLEALNTRKNLIGSSVAGSIGGFNAHAANIVAACFLATGQDPAQVVEGSQTMTLLERVVDENGKVGLHASVTMKSLEVAARGGGTALQPQAAIVNHYISGINRTEPGSSARRVASVIASTVLAGELSLMAALCNGDLVKSHMKLGRVQQEPQAKSDVL